jgi:hypothetical protein
MVVDNVDSGPNVAFVVATRVVIAAVESVSNVN